MVRTKADGLKAAGGKAAHKTVHSSVVTPKSKSFKTNNASPGGNTYRPVDTPDWQKPITSFFGNNGKGKENESSEGSSETPVVNPPKDGEACGGSQN